MEVQVGDVIQIGDQMILVLETDDDEVIFKVCTPDDPDHNFPPIYRSPQPR